MRYDIIAGLSEPGIKSKVELIEHLIKRDEMQKPNQQFGESIFSFLSEKEKISYLGNYCLIGPKYALGCLVGHFLYHYTSVEDFKEQIALLRSLSDYIKEFGPSQRTLLRKTTAVKLIDIIEKFGLPDYFLRASNDRPLRVYFIPYTHIQLNAGYFPYLNSIVSSRPKEDGPSPEYIFVHEVGHLLIFNLTGDPEKVPDSFIKFNKKFRPAWDGDLVEVFVDLFSIAIMMDTEFAHKNPFLTVFSVEDQKTVKDYFVRLIKTLKSERKVDLTLR